VNARKTSAPTSNANARSLLMANLL